MITLFLRDIFECPDYRSKLQEKLDDLQRESQNFIEIHELFSLTSNSTQDKQKEEFTRNVLIFMKDRSTPDSNWEFFMKIIKPMPLLLPTRPNRECYAWKDVGLGFLVVDAHFFKPFVSQLWKSTAYKNKDLLLNNLSAARLRDVTNFLCANPDCRRVACLHLLQHMLSTTKTFFSKFRASKIHTSSRYAIDVSDRQKQGDLIFPPIEAYVLNALVEDHLYTERTITMLVEAAFHTITNQPYPLERKILFQTRLTRLRCKYRFPAGGDGGRDLGRRLVGNVWFGIRFKEAYLREQQVMNHQETIEPVTVATGVAWGLHA